MELQVVFAQRKQRYDGEHGLEALAVVTEYDYDQNPEYIRDTLAENEASGEFEAVKIVKLTVPEAAVRAILFPQSKAIQAAVSS